MSLGNKTSSISDIRNNLAINGDFGISQRGNFTTPQAVEAGVSTYTVDRFRTYAGVTYNYQHLTDNQPEGYNGSSLRITATGTNVASYGHIDQPVEGFDKFVGKTMTLSCWVKSNTTNAYIQIHDGVSTRSELHSGNEAWEKMTVKHTFSSSPSGASLYFVLGQDQGVTQGLTSGDYMEIAGVKLEYGSIATEFEPKTYAEELFLSQRYYYRLNYTGNYDLWDATVGTSQSYTYTPTRPYPRTMRVVPSTSSSDVMDNTSSHWAFLTATSFAISPTKAGFALNLSGGSAGLRSYMYLRPGSWIGFDAEM